MLKKIIFRQTKFDKNFGSKKVFPKQNFFRKKKFHQITLFKKKFVKKTYVIIDPELNLALIVRLTPAQLWLVLVKPFYKA